MFSKLGLALVTVVVIGGLAGCATPPLPSVDMPANHFASQTGRVGVTMTALPKIDTEFPGAGCLLCMAAAATANSDLTAYAGSLSYEDLPKLKEAMADAIRKKNIDVVVISEDLKLDDLTDFGGTGANAAKKNFAPLKEKYKIDRLVVINITFLGFTRTYSAYFATSDPKGILRGTGYMVNLATNTYEWYQPVLVARSADKTWDEPPKFPGLTNAYFQALEMGKDKYLEPFSK